MPAEVYTQEIDGIKAKFMKKYGDHELEEVVNLCDGPLDLSQIPMFNAAMSKQRKAVEMKMMEKDKALAERVAQATLDELLSHIKSVAQTIREYVKIFAKSRRGRETAEKAYQEQRYKKGLARVEEHMRECVTIECSSPVYFPENFAKMQHTAMKLIPTTRGSTLLP